MNRSAAILTRARALVQAGESFLNAFRRALLHVPAAKSSRRLAAVMYSAGKPRNIARHLQALAEDPEAKAPAADVRSGALIDAAAALRRRAHTLRATARDEFSVGLADELDAQADEFEDAAEHGRAVR